MKSRVQWIALLAVACLLACGALVAMMAFSTAIFTFAERLSAPRIGQPAPDFSLRSLSGDTVQLRDLRGRPVMLTFAASWCPACRDEAPFQQRVHVQHPELVMLLVDSNESGADAQRFAADFGITFPVLLDTSGAVMSRYRVYAIPTTFFIDGQGMVRGLVVDEVTDELLAQQLPLIGAVP